MTETSHAASPRPLAGPAFGPVSGGAPEWLFVLLHGLGADGHDLIGLAPHLAEILPGARFVSPDGPEPCDMAPFGRQWFSLQDRDIGVLHMALERARADLDPFVDAELARFALPPERLVLGGFSQGAMTALHVGLRRRPGPAAILAFSGMLVGRNRLADEIESHPPVLIVHGTDDEIMPVARAAEAEAALTAEGIDVQAHVLEGLGHGIDERALALARRFLKRVVRTE